MDQIRPAVTLQLTKEIDDLLINRYQKQIYRATCVLEVTQVAKRVGLEIYIAVKVNRYLQKLRDRGESSNRPIGHVCIQLKNDKLFEAVFIRVNDLKKTGHKLHSIALIGARQIALDDTFTLMGAYPFSNLEYYITRLLKGENCGRLGQNGETSTTKRPEGWFSPPKSTISVAIIDELPNQQEPPQLQFNIDAHETIPTIPGKLILNKEISELLEKRISQTYSLHITLKKEGQKKTDIALKIKEIIDSLKNSQQICNKPIAKVYVTISDLEPVHEAVFIRVVDLRKKGIKTHSICLVGDKQILLFEDVEIARPFNNTEYVISLLKGENCGQLLTNNQQSQKSKRVDWFTWNSTVSIQKPLEIDNQPIIYRFIETQEGEILPDIPGSSSVDEEEKKFEVGVVDFIV